MDRTLESKTLSRLKILDKYADKRAMENSQL